MKQRLVKWLAAAVLAVGCTTLTVGAFTDTENHWAASAINKWSQEYGIIQGYDDGTFRPHSEITRAQFAKIAVGFFETTKEEYAGCFTDVTPDAWYSEYEEQAAALGIE